MVEQDDGTADRVRLDRPDDTGVAALVLTRPRKRNAIDVRMVESLHEALDTIDSWVDERDAEGRPALRALVLAAEGPMFCAGGDLKAMLGRRGDAAAQVRYLDDGLHRVMRRLADLAVPVVAAVQGPAVGAGIGLALACDLVVWTAGTSLTWGFVPVGLGPDAGASWWLHAAVGRHAASRLLLLAEPLSTEDALAAGLGSHLASDAAATAALAGSLARHLAEQPPLALRLVRDALRRAPAASYHEALLTEARLGGEAMASDDHAAAVDARLEGRSPPVFTGR